MSRVLEYFTVYSQGPTPSHHQRSCAERTTDSELFIPASLSTSTHFLPRLSALDTPHFQLLEVLLPGRSLNNIRIRRSLSHSDLETLARHGLRVTAKVSQLQIQCAVDNLNACLASLTFIAQHFVNINALGMHFVLPSGNIPPWEDFEATANQILPLLHALRHLHAFSLTTTPDPVIVHDHRGERRTAGFPLVNYEKKTRELARTITESVPGLRRVELRWHGWMQQSGQWVPISQNKLMRRVWFNAEQRRVQSSKSG
ncbi:hypothetical protein OBBRIDRAFT_460238 [Obba rivulosa]|uniref:Uncharacterized protein n=1 Tax=Obba rivulosa TaxID=1052685 RepID=A0A8E2B1L5_9APHY|nr:hypothetical protein OBBRIDRAFT_460238 [Obba rivulosa]